MWKLGGTYLDLDIIATNPLESLVDGKLKPLGRFIAREESEQLNNAAMRFPKEDPFVWVLMENFVEKFDGYTWLNPKLIVGQTMVRFASLELTRVNAPKR